MQNQRLLDAELELIRILEGGRIAPDCKVEGVVERSASEERVDALLRVVESLRQEVKSLQTAVQAVTSSSFFRTPTPLDTAPSVQSKSSVPSLRHSVDCKSGCWECGCPRHIQQDCPYLQGN